MVLGTLYTISAPSGAGKTSLVKALLDKMSDIGVSVSHTTRDMRPGETNGEDYFFTDAANFLDMIEGKQFLEHAKVFRNHYGTSKQAVNNMLDSGQDVILEIDWQGMQQVKELCPDCISISVLPPSLGELANRLAGRQTDSTEEIAHRMSQAKEEMSHAHECDFLVINDDFQTALDQLCSIISAHRLSTQKQSIRYQSLLQSLS